MAVIKKEEVFSRPEIFNVGTGRKTAIRDVIETFADLIDGREYLKIGTRSLRAGEVPFFGSREFGRNGQEIKLQ